MAGAGFKTFNTGDVLTASDVNTYLMQQTVMVFDDAAARTSALGANVAEGMMSYLKDTNKTYRYDGSAWLDDAGTTSPLTTKGDVWGYSTTDARIPVGANGTVLTADSAETLGVKWATPASGGMTLINTGGTSLSGTTTITSIPATYNYLYLEVVGYKPVSDNAQLGLRFNGDTNNNRYYRSDIASGLGSVGFNSDRFYISAGQDNGSDNSLIIANIYGYANTSTWKMTSGYGLGNNDATPANINYWTFGGFYNQTAAISSITFVTSTGGITAGTAYLYGVK